MLLLSLITAIAGLPETHAQVFTLANGLKVVLEEDHRTDQIALHLSYGVGSRDEHKAEHGCAHLFEHLMFEGSGHVPNNAFDEWLTAAGGWNNAFTSEDETAYHMVFPSGALDLALFLESDRMGFLQAGLTQDNLTNQQGVVLQERYQGYSEPNGRDYDALTRLLFPKGHPYHVPVIGTVEDIQAFTVPGVVDFWQRHYRPRNAVLTLVGNFDTKPTLERVQQWFSDVPDRGPAVERDPVWSGQRASNNGVVFDDVEDRSLMVSWPTVPLGHADEHALDVLSWIVDGGPGTRMYDKLYRNSGIASSISVWSGASEIDGMFVVEASSEHTSLPKLLSSIEKVLADIIRHPPDDEEMKRARRSAIGGLEDALEAPEDRAHLLTSCFKQYHDPNCVDEEIAALRKVDAGDVVAVTQRYILPERRVTLATVRKGDEGLDGASEVVLP